MEYACRNCRYISDKKPCPNCGSQDLSTKWEGEIIILNPEKSKIAKLLNIIKPGRYAIEVK